MRKIDRGWGYDTAVRHGYSSYLRIWSGCPTTNYENHDSGFAPWVVEYKDAPDEFWIVDGAGPMDEEPRLFGPYTDAQQALTAAEMLVVSGYEG